MRKVLRDIGEGRGAFCDMAKGTYRARGRNRTLYTLARYGLTKTVGAMGYIVITDVGREVLK